MAQRREYEAIVVGAGQGGVPLAMAFARHGRSTALVEAVHVGGTCVNEGCTPTKTMVASARVAHLAHRAADYGVRTGDLSIDLERVRKRKRDIVDMFRSGSERRVEETENLELIRGRAAFTGPRRLEVTSAGGGRRELVAETVVRVMKVMYRLSPRDQPSIRA